MRRSIAFSILVLSFAAVVLAGCSKNKTTAPDTTAPTVSITSPSANSVVRDSVIIVASAADNRGIAAVDFFVDGDSLTSVTHKPYQAVWRLAGETFGAHELQCRARDTSGHKTLSETVPVSISDVVFTANFTNDWLLSTEGTGLLFISDSDGAVLAETTWVGNRSLDLRAAAGVTMVPGRIDVTVATRDASGEHVSLVTNRGVSPRGWTWRGRSRPEFGETPGEVTLTFTGAPNLIGFVVSSPWADEQDYAGPLPGQMAFPLHDQSNNLFVIYGTRSGAARYKWFNGVTTGGTGQYAADLTGAAAAGQKTVTLPAEGQAYAASLYGFPTAGNHHAGVYLLSTAGSTSHASSTVLYYPTGSVITDFMSRIRVNDTADGKSYWGEARTGTIGAIPSSFTVIGATLGFLNESPSSFSMLVLGEADQVRSCWQAQGGGSDYRWFIYSSASDLDYALHELPPTFNTLFGGVATGAFALQYAELIDYPQLDSYDDVIAETFRSTSYFADTINTVRIKGRWAAGVAPGETIAHHNNTRDAFGGQR
jgi:hypothetical protein